LSTNRDLLAAAFGPGAPKGEPGGIGLAPDVSAWVGRRLEGDDLTPDNLPRLIHRRGGVVVHGGGWCGDPRRIRAARGGQGERIEEAARRRPALVEALEVDARAARCRPPWRPLRRRDGQAPSRPGSCRWGWPLAPHARP